MNIAMIKEKLLGRYIRATVVTSLLNKKHPLRDINKLYGPRELMKIEGFMRTRQAQYFTRLLIEKPKIKRIAEIGFNAGHSSFIFLNTRPDTEVVSFDIAKHPYIDKAQKFIAERFPGWHKLYRGDSKTSVPGYTKENPGEKFDLIFIDGGHDYETSVADLNNMQKLAAPGAIVVADDYMPNVSWGVGPSRAWDEAVARGLVMQDDINSEKHRRIWVTGHYTS